MTKQTTLPRISSLAEPSEQDIAALEALSDDDRRRLIEAEIERGFKGRPRKLSAKDIIDKVDARRRNG